MKRKLTPAVMHALRCMGRNIRIARKRRRIPVADFAARLGVSSPTVLRLERGEPGVSVGCLAQALRALGELHRLEEFLDMADDDAGLMLEVAELPQRIRSRCAPDDHVAEGEAVAAPDGDPMAGAAL
ncbi:MAG: helix-turn-helix transcriptional regulator [Boseongicola sp.]|nr:helix-turn-helix transcriptional regulator [Boseongicola sp.]